MTRSESLSGMLASSAVAPVSPLATAGISHTDELGADLVPTFVNPRNTYTRAASSGTLSALMRASAIGMEERVRELLDDDADVNARGPRGSTALMFAAGGGHLEIVKLLIEHGADPNLEEDGGWTALSHASEDGEHEIEEYLRSCMR